MGTLVGSRVIFPVGNRSQTPTNGCIGYIFVTCRKQGHTLGLIELDHSTTCGGIPAYFPRLAFLGFFLPFLGVKFVIFFSKSACARSGPARPVVLNSAPSI